MRDWMGHILRSGQDADLSNEHIRRTVMYNGTILVAVVMISSFSIPHLRVGWYSLTGVQLTLLLINVLTMIWLYRRRGRGLERAVTIWLGTLFLFFTATLVHGGFDKSAPLWHNLFPVLALLFSGWTRGILWSLAFISMTAALFVLHLSGLILLPYPSMFFTVTLASLVTMTVVVYFYVWPTNEGEAISNSKHKALEGVNQRLQQEVAMRRAVEEKLRHSSQRLQQLSQHDPLTGLPNRMMFIEQMHHTLSRAIANDTKLVILLLDIDNLGLLNQQFGHQAGDQLLMTLSQRLEQLAGVEQLTGRFGGDEFAVAWSGDEELNDPQAQADALREQLQRPVSHEGHMLSASISLGWAAYPHQGRNEITLLETARMAMYQEKRQKGG